MNYSERDLLDNQLSFLATHRGTVRDEGGAIFIESEKPEFTYAILGLNSSSKDIPQRTHRVQILPGCKISDEDLRGLGFSRIFGVSYMVLENPPDWRLAEGLSVDEVGGSQSSMDVFSETQAKGFSENEADYQAWHPFLKAANDRNLMNSHQHFYVGYLKSEPVGTVLTVQAKNLLGIYAVATLARHRKAGIGTTVMERAIRDARALNPTTITLQVKQDSPAEDFYRHLGFKRSFVSGVYRRHI